MILLDTEILLFWWRRFSVFTYALALSFAGEAVVITVSRGIVLGAGYVGGIIAEFYSKINVNYPKSSSSGNGETKKDKSKPKQNGVPNSREFVKNKNGEVEKYTEFDSDGKFEKEVRLTGKERGHIKRPNVKEPK